MAETKTCRWCGDPFRKGKSYSKRQWEGAHYCSIRCSTKGSSKAARDQRPECACGCGERVKRKERPFNPGHSRRLRPVRRETFNARLNRWYVFDGKRWRTRYRVLMEQHLGRQLREGEVVHHKNGDSTDDRIENLEVFGSNGEHVRVGHSGEARPCGRCGTPAKPLRRGMCQRCYDYLRRH